MGQNVLLYYFVVFVYVREDVCVCVCVRLYVCLMVVNNITIFVMLAKSLCINYCVERKKRREKKSTVKDILQIIYRQMNLNYYCTE